MSLLEFKRFAETMRVTFLDGLLFGVMAFGLRTPIVLVTTLAGVVRSSWMNDSPSSLAPLIKLDLKELLGPAIRFFVDRTPSNS